MTVRIDRVRRAVHRRLVRLREFGEMLGWVPVKIMARRRPSRLKPRPSSSPPSIIMTVITYRRPKLLRQTLGTFLEHNPALARRLPIVLLLQDPSDAATATVVKEFRDYIVDTIVPESNLGIARGYSELMRVALGRGADFVLHLEDDWECRSSIEPFFEEILGALSGSTDLGYIRMRSVYEPVASHNLITRRTIRYTPRTPHVWSSNSHFTFNPTVIRADVVARLIPVDAELGCMVGYERLGLRTGHLMHDAFRHIGHQREAAWQL